MGAASSRRLRSVGGPFFIRIRHPGRADAMLPSPTRRPSPAWKP
ncbi:hypothetical protein BN940_02606 [Castellaniella defragrans 65Phen]|uniref:Uncharacterized protein n=1 Tax=Castellaniella defragrans (strain DSM 12143 / CCUG 39792 / 65Phen) TaxID=1437824 RepID=W8X137_CASD6|nr:hypothetical protein BN940_02606 [Castellaniella defragrans 65Phen]